MCVILLFLLHFEDLTEDRKTGSFCAALDNFLQSRVFVMELKWKCSAVPMTFQHAILVGTDNMR